MLSSARGWKGRSQSRAYVSFVRKTPSNILFRGGSDENHFSDLLISSSSEANSTDTKTTPEIQRGDDNIEFFGSEEENIEEDEIPYPYIKEDCGIQDQHNQQVYFDDEEDAEFADLAFPHPEDENEAINQDEYSNNDVYGLPEQCIDDKEIMQHVEIENEYQQQFEDENEFQYQQENNCDTRYENEDHLDAFSSEVNNEEAKPFMDMQYENEENLDVFPSEIGNEEAEPLVDPKADDIKYRGFDQTDVDFPTMEQESDESSSFQGVSSTKSRSSSDVILDLITRSGVDTNIESQELRQLITVRIFEYLEDLYDSQTLPHPKKLLHYLAPKIPAIKHSPDVLLEIKSARSDLDSGVSACLIGLLGHVCEIYEKEYMERFAVKEFNNVHPRSVVDDIITDRRFEQLVECLLCGVNVKKRLKEHFEQQQRTEDDDSKTEDIEDLLMDEVSECKEGLSIRDSCRAAWGLVMLGAHKQENMGGEKISDLLMALSLRTRELLLAKLQVLRQGDLYDGDATNSVNVDDRIMQLSEELAEDAATAMWCFACVRFCTNMTYYNLFEVCFSILCQDPYDARRRAQDTEASLDSHVGSNDIVERLAMSETVAVSGKTNAVKRSEDALIDWLSPKEITDAIWALALHGGKNGESWHEKEEITGTLNAFRELAFDRIICWLHKELKSVKQQKKMPGSADAGLENVDGANIEFASNNELLETGYEADGHDEAPKGYYATVPQNDENECSTTGEHVEDPTLDLSLAAEDQIIENMTDEIDGNIAGTSAVELVDASTILAAEKAMQDSSIEMESAGIATVVQDATVVEGTADSSDQQLDTENCYAKSVEQVSGYQAESKYDEHCFHAAANLKHFSAHDLCSIAWAATELRDPLRSKVTYVVLKILFSVGPRIMRELNGADLSNLAWSVAVDSKESNYSERSDEMSHVISNWISDEVYRASDKYDLLKRFQPPELSRFMWAIATFNTARVEGTRMVGAAEELGYLGLTTAASNLAVFSIEDLARILWAFLALSHSEEVFKNPGISESFGKILATIETSLLQWENCKSSWLKGDDLSRETNLFTSFLGRTRLHFPFLDHRLDDTNEVEEALFSVHPENKLPLLKDLPLDPLTLVKLACYAERVTVNRQGLNARATLTRITLRLMTSRSGRLLRACPIHDLVHLCEAAALTDFSAGRELISHFSRRIISFLNDEWLGENNSIHSALSPGDAATLLWALGELGVKYKYQTDENGKFSPHRRLHLTSKLPFVDKQKLIVLSDSSLAKLLRGYVNMHVVVNDKEQIVEFLDFIEGRASSISNKDDICHLVESIGMLILQVETSPQGGHKSMPESKGNLTTDRTDQGLVIPQDEISEELLDISIERCTKRIATSLLTKLTPLVPILRADQIRKVLVLLSLLPFQADDLVKTFETEILYRKALLEESASLEVDSFLAQLSLILTGLTTGDGLFSEGQDESSSRLSLLKNSLKSLFKTSSPSVEGEPGEENPMLNQDLCLLQELLKVNTDFQRRLEMKDRAANLSLGSMIDDAQTAAVLELGRCLELINHYRNIDFTTGKPSGRFDQKFKRDMMKRVLSRHLL